MSRVKVTKQQSANMAHLDISGPQCDSMQGDHFGSKVKDIAQGQMPMSKGMLKVKELLKSVKNIQVGIIAYFMSSNAAGSNMSRRMVPAETARAG